MNSSRESGGNRRESRDEECRKTSGGVAGNPDGISYESPPGTPAEQTTLVELRSLGGVIAADSIDYTGYQVHLATEANGKTVDELYRIARENRYEVQREETDSDRPVYLLWPDELHSENTPDLSHYPLGE